MKHKKNKIVISLFLLSATTQVFSMGSKLPSQGNLTNILSSTRNSGSAGNLVSKLPVSSTQLTNSLGQLPNLISLLPALISPSPLSLASLPTLLNLLPTLINLVPSQAAKLPIPTSLPVVSTTPIVSTPILASTSAPTLASTATNQEANPIVSDAGAYSDQIKTLVANSACANYSWRNRGQAPIGYINGVALSYARSLCRLKTASALSAVMSAASSGNSAKDGLALYQSNFSALSIPIKNAGEAPLRATYVLGMGLGMRESSGSYCEGWDKSAGSNRSSSAAEAGVFQTSYDSIGSSPELSKLYAEYKASPERCLLPVFKEGVSCGTSNILGSGAGAEYQAFNKSCPAFATEYAMVMLRVQRSHYGPINRKEAEAIPACNQLLTSIQDFIDSDSYACQDLI